MKEIKRIRNTELKHERNSGLWFSGFMFTFGCAPTIVSDRSRDAYIYTHIYTYLFAYYVRFLVNVYLSITEHLQDIFHILMQYHQNIVIIDQIFARWIFVTCTSINLHHCGPSVNPVLFNEQSVCLGCVVPKLTAPTLKEGIYSKTPYPSRN